MYVSLPPRHRLPGAVILSPNLGCPQLVASEEVNSSAVMLVLATFDGEQSDWSVYTVKVRPSYADEGQPFELSLSEPEMLEGPSTVDQGGIADSGAELVGNGHELWTMRSGGRRIPLVDTPQGDSWQVPSTDTLARNSLLPKRQGGFSPCMVVVACRPRICRAGGGRHVCRTRLG